MIGIWNLERGELFRVGNLILEFEKMDGLYAKAYTRSGQLVIISGYVEVLD